MCVSVDLSSPWVNALSVVFCDEKPKAAKSKSSWEIGKAVILIIPLEQRGKDLAVGLKTNSDPAFPLLPFCFPHCCTASSCQNLTAASPEDSELPTGLSRTSPGPQERDASLAPPKQVFLSTRGSSECLGVLMFIE